MPSSERHKNAKKKGSVHAIKCNTCKFKRITHRLSILYNKKLNKG